MAVLLLMQFLEGSHAFFKQGVYNLKMDPFQNHILVSCIVKVFEHLLICSYFISELSCIIGLPRKSLNRPWGPHTHVYKYIHDLTTCNNVPASSHSDYQTLDKEFMRE